MKGQTTAGAVLAAVIALSATGVAQSRGSQQGEQPTMLAGEVSEARKAIGAAEDCRHAMANASGAPGSIDQQKAKCDQEKPKTAQAQPPLKGRVQSCWSFLDAAAAEFKIAEQLYDQARRTPRQAGARINAEALRHHQIANDNIAKFDECFKGVLDSFPGLFGPGDPRTPGFERGTPPGPPSNPGPPTGGKGITRQTVPTRPPTIIPDNSPMLVAAMDRCLARGVPGYTSFGTNVLGPHTPLYESLEPLGKAFYLADQVADHALNFATQHFLDSFEPTVRRDYLVGWLIGCLDRRVDPRDAYWRYLVRFGAADPNQQGEAQNTNEHFRTFVRGNKPYESPFPPDVVPGSSPK